MLPRKYGQLCRFSTYHKPLRGRFGRLVVHIVADDAARAIPQAGRSDNRIGPLWRYAIGVNYIRVSNPPTPSREALQGQLQETTGNSQVDRLLRLSFWRKPFILAGCCVQTDNGQFLVVRLVYSVEESRNPRFAVATSVGPVARTSVVFMVERVEKKDQIGGVGGSAQKKKACCQTSFPACRSFNGRLPCARKGMGVGREWGSGLELRLRAPWDIWKNRNNPSSKTRNGEVQ